MLDNPQSRGKKKQNKTFKSSGVNETDRHHEDHNELIRLWMYIIQMTCTFNSIKHRRDQSTKPKKDGLGIVKMPYAL